jgi:hypothetical protein
MTEAPQTKKRSVTARLLSSPSDLDTLLKNLDFSEKSVADAARNQAQLFAEASRYYVKKMRVRIQAEQHMEFVESEVNLQIRWHDKEKGDKRTEGHVKALINKSKRVVAARKEYARAQTEETWSKLLVDAYRHRNGAIRIVADLLGAEIAFENKISPGQVRELGSMKRKLARKREQEEISDD